MVHEEAAGTGPVGPRDRLAGRTPSPLNRRSRNRARGQGPVLFRTAVPEGGL
jgi:hypothetical protein